MQMMHLSVRSIGEVLATLKQEFPDVTISKIRFLESQGLVTPKRTASGYRQFSDDDLARLRYILRQQRENFLPLKVIKGRLDEKPQAAADTEKPAAAPRTSVVAPLVEGGTLSRNELIKESGLTEGQVRELEEFGFLAGPAFQRWHLVRRRRPQHRENCRPFPVFWHRTPPPTQFQKRRRARSRALQAACPAGA